MTEKESVFLLLGPEEGEKDRFIERLIRRLSKAMGEEPEIQRFYAFDASVGQVLAVLRNGNLFASHQVVILNNVEEITRKEDIQLLKYYCARPAPGATLILLSPEVGKVSKSLEKSVSKENRIIFWELFPGQKIGWIVGYFKKRKVHIDAEAAQFLLDMVENNTRELQRTCERLALFFGEEATITYRDIEEIIFHSKDENVFTLFDKVSRRDFPAALEILHKILLSRDSEPIQILSGLLFQYRRLLALLRLLAERYSLHEAFQHLKLSSKRIQKSYQEGAAKYGLEELERIIMLTARFDVRLRSLKANLQPLVLELFLYYAIVRGGQGAWSRPIRWSFS